VWVIVVIARTRRFQLGLLDRLPDESAGPGSRCCFQGCNLISSCWRLRERRTCRPEVTRHCFTFRVTTERFSIRPLVADDWPCVEAIYVAGIATGNATFETEPPSWDHFDHSRLAEHRAVAVDLATDRVLGWVAVSPVSNRRVYAGVVEHSVYVDPAASGRGVGRALLEALIASTEAAGIWTIQSGVFPENSASLALHQRCGFRVVGTRRRLGQHLGRWRDVVLLERRSSVV
jgi:L-amino acid N-acyltransferase YncA